MLKKITLNLQRHENMPYPCCKCGQQYTMQPQRIDPHIAAKLQTKKGAVNRRLLFHIALC